MYIEIFPSALNRQEGGREVAQRAEWCGWDSGKGDTGLAPLPPQHRTHPGDAVFPGMQEQRPGQTEGAS